MLYFLIVLCGILLITVCILAFKNILLSKAAEELRTEFAARLSEDTNVGIDLSTSNKKMKQLAADMDRQLKLLRKEYIRYTSGNQELKDAITNVSHDLRTPLTAICGYMELLSQETMSDSARTYLSIIDNRVQALKELTEELFRYSIILSVDSYDKKEALSLNSALESCIAAYYGALKQTGIEPEISMPHTAVICKLNAQALSRILSNIVSNVIKYSDGDLQIRLTEDGTLQFCNHADNLDQVQVGHLFDRFFTVEDGLSSTGLGLSIAKTLTEEMGGQIEATLEQKMLKITLKFPN